MKLKHFVLSLLTVLTIFTNNALAADHSTISLAVGGYDLVSYQQGNPKRGSGHHIAQYKGNTYAFDTNDNKEAFNADPEKYLPQFGGYCAYGAALGKKFYGDPTVYEVVDGKLYLNLDPKVQGLWNKNKHENIKTAHELWHSIKYVPAEEL